MTLSPHAHRNPLVLSVLNHTYSQLYNKEDYERVANILHYYKVNWTGGQRRMRKYILIYKNSMKFQTGFLPYLERFFVVVKYNGLGYLEPKIAGELKNISFYEDQIEILRKAKRERRGVIKAPTGSGKTIVAVGLIAMYEPEICLFIVHTEPLLKQTIEEFGKFFPGEVGIIGDGLLEWNRITVGTVQTLKNMKLVDKGIDMVIVDEVHHCPSISYRKVLNQLVNASVRYGLTGTLRKDKEGRLWTQGLLGPVIAEVESAELIDKGRLAVPKIIFKQVPFHMSIAELKNYREVYDRGIVFNDVRNRLIVETVRELRSRGTCLVQIKEVRQGKELEKLGVGVLIEGSTASKKRAEIKEAFKKKDIPVVISSPIWGEGCDIPAIDSVVLAGGGLSEIQTLQKVGRGLRRTKEKDKVLIVDFLDTTHSFLRRHSRERRKIYVAEGWEVGGISEEMFDGRRMKK